MRLWLHHLEQGGRRSTVGHCQPAAAVDEEVAAVVAADGSKSSQSGSSVAVGGRNCVVVGAVRCVSDDDLVQVA